MTEPPPYAPQPAAPYNAWPQPPAAAPRPPRRGLRTALAWTAAVLVFAGTAGGAGYGLTRAERGDLPLLATETDGRWDYPELTLPKLPHGAPEPLDSDANPAAVHHADLRELLLPLPEGGKADPEVAVEDGWVTPKEFAEVYAKDERDTVVQALTDDAVRHIAARAWVMPDGTRTRIYLLQFNTGALADHFYDQTLSDGVNGGRELAEAPATVLDESWPENTGIDGVDLYVYDEEKPYGERHARQAYVVAGDTVALILQAHEGGAAKVPFQQTLILQHQLLG